MSRGFDCVKKGEKNKKKFFLIYFLFLLFKFKSNSAWLMGVYRGRQQSRGISEGFLNGKMGRVFLCGGEKKQSGCCTGKG